MKSTLLVWSSLLACLPPAAPLRAQSPTPPPGRPQTGFVPGSRELFSVDFASVPAGEFPKQLHTIQGSMTMVTKDGVPALRASDVGVFLINLRERLPDDFTVELDLIPKACCNPWDLEMEATPAQDGGSASMVMLWSPDGLQTFGGGDGYSRKMPEDLQPLLHGQLSEVRLSVKGTMVVMYTNGQKIWTLDRKIPRGRVFRVKLGGQDADKQAVYLTKLRIATNSPAAP
jgi:hypothetical protein